MSKKYIVQCSIHTYSDWYIDKKFIDPDHVSRYFENNLYEYTYVRGCTYKFRRVFEKRSDASKFLINMKNAISGENNETKYVKEFLKRNISDFITGSDISDIIDANTVFKLRVSEIETDAKQIKKITYKGK